MKLRQFGAVLWTLLSADIAGGQTSALEEKLQAQAEAAVAIIDGTVQVPALRRGVRVQRDRWGVAHIYAKNQHDLFFAQGFVAAQDRLFQMEIWKRSGQGGWRKFSVPRRWNAISTRGGCTIAGI